MLRGLKTKRFWREVHFAVLAVLVLMGGPWSAERAVASDHDHGTKFYGTIQALPVSGLVGDWVVSGRVVRVSAWTRIEQEHGVVALGAYVEVEGSTQGDGSIVAWKVEVKSSGSGGVSSTKLYGVIEVLPVSGLVGDWVVSGRVVHVTASTWIEQEHGVVALGAYVEVEGSAQGDCSIVAWKVEVKSSPAGDANATGPTARFAVVRLFPPTSAPARGEGKAIVKQFLADGVTLREDLVFKVEHLLPATVYDAYVDGIHAGSTITNYEGEGKLFLSTSALPGAEPLPRELQPLDQRRVFEVRLGSDKVLVGSLSQASWLGYGAANQSLIFMAPLLKAGGVVVGGAVGKVEGSEQELKVAGFGLPPLTQLQVVVDGAVLGAAATGPSGELRVSFSTKPDDDSQLLPDSALPVASWTQLELKDNQGNVVAAGQFGGPLTPESEKGTNTARRYLGRRRS